MKLFIDADYIVYKSCAGAETEIDWGDDVIVVTSKFSEAYKNVQKELINIQLEFGGFAQPILFFSDSKNFRKDILDTYKGHRNRKKPCGYKRVINSLMNEYRVIQLASLEADDAMGIYATKYPGNIIVSPDKDMRQIPGEIFNMTDRFTVTPEEGAKWHLIQTLAGDQTDGYSGVPGIGIKRAVALFEQDGYSWQTVVKAFADKGLGEDFGRKQPILWNPDADYTVEDGTKV